jgi:hypothetical protein
MGFVSSRTAQISVAHIFVSCLGIVTENTAAAGSVVAWWGCETARSLGLVVSIINHRTSTQAAAITRASVFILQKYCGKALSLLGEQQTRMLYDKLCTDIVLN